MSALAELVGEDVPDAAGILVEVLRAVGGFTAPERQEPEQWVALLRDPEHSAQVPGKCLIAHGPQAESAV